MPKSFEEREEDGGGWSAALARLSVRFFALTLLVAGIVSWLALDAATHIRLDTSLEALMPEGVASVDNLKKALDHTGSFASAIVVLSGAQPEVAERFAEDLRSRVLERFDWVSAAEYAEDYSVFERHKLLYLETGKLQEIRDAVSESTGANRRLPAEIQGAPLNIRLRTMPPPPPLPPEIRRIAEDLKGEQSPANGAGAGEARRLFRSGDGDVTLLVVWPREGGTGLGLSRRIIGDLQAAAAELDPASYAPDLRIEVGGRIYNRVVQFDAVMSDLSSSGFWSLGLIVALLALYFRSLWAVPAIALPLVLGILWTMGLTALVIGQLNIVSVFLVLILFGLGVDFGIHNLSRYREERAKGGTCEAALTAVYSHTGAASLVAATTTAAGFFALLLTDFRAFREFGFIAGAGVVLTFVAMYSVFPALLVLADRLGLTFARANPATGGTARRLPLGAQRLLAGLVMAAALLAAWQAMGVQFENDFGRLQAPRSAEHTAMQARISKVFPDGTDRAVLIVDTLEEVRAIRRYFEDYIAADTETPTIKKVETFYSFAPLPEVQAARLGAIRDIRGTLKTSNLPEAMADEAPRNWRDYLDVGALTPDDLPQGLRRVFTGLPGREGHLIYIFNAVSMNKADLARQFADDIREIEVDGRTYHPAAEGLIFVDMLDLMKRDALDAILLVAGVTALLVALFFRRPRDIAIVLAPVSLALLILFGMMGAFGIRLSIFNMVILPTLIGIGVDNAIHIVHRAREEGSMATAISAAGPAAAVTTITTMFGFVGMLSASMGGLYSLGLVATVGFLACLFTTFTVLPAAGLMRKERE